MAEQKKKKKTAVGSGKSSTARTAKASTKKTKKKGSAPRKQQGKSNAAQAAKRKRFSEQYLPYILGALGVLLLACFVLHFMKIDATPTEHLMGPVGYWLCYCLFGIFGWTALAAPVLLIILAIFWRKYYEEGFVALRVVLSVVLMTLIAAVIHVCAVGGTEDMTYFVDILFKDGAALKSGGVLGGLLGWLLYMGVRIPGTIIITVIAAPLILMFLFGVTPAYVFSRMIKSMKASKARRAARRAAEDDEDEDEDDNEDEEEEIRRPRRPMKEAVADEDDEGEAYVPAERVRARREKPVKEKPVKEKPEKTPVRRKDGRPITTLHVDPTTGEIIDEEDVTDHNSTTPAENETPAATEPADEYAPWDDIPPEEELAEDTEEMDENTARGLNATEEEESTAEESSLYVPASRPGARPTARRGQTVPTGFNPADEDTMEVSMEEEAPASREQREHIVVNVLPQDRSALTGTSDYHVDGLTEEEVVLPSGSGDGKAPKKSAEYQFPPIDLLTRGPDHYEADQAEIAKNTQALREVLESFHIRVREIDCSCGPTITRYEVKPDTGVRVRSIANLVDDIALGLAKSGVRIEAPIPGKSAVGIEVPNANPATVALRNLLETPEFVNHKSRIAACLGADVAGRPVIMDINKMPHLLVAGATGSGKSVCINSIIMSIIYKAKPEDVKLILIDPKKVEFAVYRDLPHLYAPIVSDPKKAAGCLNSAVNEMERRFELIEEVGVRNLAGYNEVTAGDPERPALPQMVIIIDELADLMMTASNEVETAICRLAQKARAAGIHLILGTQRPSTDVITGLIKANIPSRIAFTVASQIDSRTIIDSMGAEKLIGRGDMLYAPVGVTKPLRVQGTFVSDGEVEKVVTYLKEHNERVPFDENFMRQIEVEAAKCGANGKKGSGGDDGGSFGGGDDEDAKFWAAVELAVDAQKVSTSLLQRRLEVGYGRAAKIIDRMEDMGFVGPADGNKPRKLLITKQDLMELRMNEDV